MTDEPGIMYVDVGYETTVWRWASAEDLARAYWLEQSLPTLDDQIGPAWHCLNRMTSRPDPRVLTVIDWLVELAPDDDARMDVGVGPLEDLLSHSGYGARFVDEVERRARQSPSFRRALEGVWLSDDVDADVRARLCKFGASDISG